MNILNDKVIDIFDCYLDNLKKKINVEGIVVLGGMGKKKYFDEFSDIDVAVFVNNNEGHLSRWLPEFEFDVFRDGTKVHFNVHQQDIYREQTEVWDDVKRDAYYSGVIAFDRNSQVTELISKKLEISSDEFQERLIRHYVKIPPTCLINPKRQLKRGYKMLAQHVLNNGIDVLIDTLFVINRKFIPHNKWKLEYSFKLEYLPKDYINRMSEAMRISSFNSEDIERRAKILEDMAKDIMMNIEEELNKSEQEIYNIACHKYLNRQLLPHTFAAQMREYIAVNELPLSIKEIDRITGFINYFLINDIQELLKFSKNDCNANIEGLNDVKKLLTYIK